MMAVQREGNPIFNEVSGVCSDYANEMLKVRDDLTKAYWEQHKLLGETSFSDAQEQIEAMDRLGRLAAAIKAVKAAHAALNNGRCW